MGGSNFQIPKIPYRIHRITTSNYPSPVALYPHSLSSTFRTLINKAETAEAYPSAGSADRLKSPKPANKPAQTAAGNQNHCCVSSSPLPPSWQCNRVSGNRFPQLRSNRTRSAASRPVRGLILASFDRRLDPVQATWGARNWRCNPKSGLGRLTGCVEAEREKTERDPDEEKWKYEEMG